MTVSTWQSEAAGTTAANHDVVVVGAGLVGSYAARLLTSAGNDVAIVEARFPGAGASGRNAGFVHLGVHLFYAEAALLLGREVTRELWNLTADNVSRVAEMASRFGVATDRKGATFVSHDADELALMRKSAKLGQQDGFDIEFLEGDPTGLGFDGALVQPDDFTVQPAELTLAMAESSGATIYVNDEVTSIASYEGGLRVNTRSRVIECEKALVAVNAYAGLLDQFFRELVTPYRAEVIMTEPVDSLPDTMFRIRGNFYYQQLKDGRLLVGGGSDRHRELCTSWSDETTPEVQRTIGALVRQYLPEVQLKAERQWAGVMGLTPDFLPIVGEIPGKPGLHYAVGFSGHGMSLGFVVAERAVEAMLNGADPGLFGVDRLI